MTLRGEELNALLQKHGYPLFVYQSASVRRACARLQQILPFCGILYSMKANPHPQICRLLLDMGVGVDAASAGEVRAARALGAPPELVFYSTPGKSCADFAATLGQCTLIADSYTELQMLEDFCAAQGLSVAAGLRINPDFSFGPGVTPEVRRGQPGKFGEDEEGLAGHRDFLRGLKHVRLTGFHVYVRSQILSATALAEYCAHVLALAQRWQQVLGAEPDFINLGGGLGISYAGMLPLTTRPCRNRPGPRTRALHRPFRAPAFIWKAAATLWPGPEFLPPVLWMSKIRGANVLWWPPAF